MYLFALLPLALLQGLTPGTHCFSLCGRRRQFAGGGVLQYRGVSGDDTVTVVNHLDSLIVRAAFLPSKNFTLQELPGDYSFCVHWFPGLKFFNFTYGLQNHTWKVLKRSEGKADAPKILTEHSCRPNTSLFNMTANGQRVNDNCWYQSWDWSNDTEFVDYEMTAVSQYLNMPVSPSTAQELRGWIDTTLSQVQFDGGSCFFGKGDLRLAVFKLDSADTLSSIRKEMGVSVSVPKELLENRKSSSPKRLHVVRVQGSSLFQDAANSTVLGNQVIGVSLEHTNVSFLQEDIVFTFQHEPVQRNVSPVCVFWDECTVGWSTYGCKTFPGEIETQCKCNHLTYFAVLMQVSSLTISEDHLVSLTVITFVGCSLSAVAALFTICWYLCRRKKQSNPTLQIHMNLLGAVLLLDLTFMVSAVLGALPGLPVCQLSAILLHAALLCTFTWMAIEGFNLYTRVVKVFHSPSLTIRKMALLGWGAPVLIVIIIILLDHHNYGPYNLKVNRDFSPNSSATICWLTDPLIHKVVNMGFFATVLLFNTVMLIAMTRCVLRLKPHTRGEQIRHCLTLLGFSCMLGVPWGLAFFSFGVLYLPVQYIFSILNSLQGFFIFLWYWVLSQQHVTDQSRSTDSTSVTPISPRTNFTTSDQKKLLT